VLRKKPLEIKIVVHSLTPEECKVLGGKPTKIGDSDACILIGKTGEQIQVEVQTIGKPRVVLKTGEGEREIT